MVGMGQQPRKPRAFALSRLFYLTTGMAIVFGIIRLTSQQNGQYMGVFVIYCLLVWTYLWPRREHFP